MFLPTLLADDFVYYLYIIKSILVLSLLTEYVPKSLAHIFFFCESFPLIFFFFYVILVLLAHIIFLAYGTYATWFKK